MKQKLFSILALLIVLSMSAWAAGETFEIKFKNKNSIVESPTGYFTYDKGEGNAVSWSANGKHSCTYGGENYDNVIKMEGATQCSFTTTVEATVTIVQTTSNATGYKLKFDGTIIDGNMSNTTVTENGDNTYNEYVITNVAAGKHTITRTSETGLAYVKVEYAPTYSVTLAEGTEDAGNWTISPSSAAEGQTVTITYNGTKRVASVTAVKKAAPAKEPATVTTAPTGAAIVGVGKTTALVSGGEAEGGTMMYKVTTTNTKPASTDGFSDAVPTAQTITASGKVYVWYYVKGDDTHSDSEIAATAIEVTVKAFPITVTWNPSDIVPEHLGDDSFTKDGITFTAATCDFQVLTFGGGGSFTTTLGNFTKIEISADFTGDVSGTGWSNDGWQSATWTGNAASVSFSGDIWGGGMTCEGGNLTIVFTID